MSFFVIFLKKNKIDNIQSNMVLLYVAISILLILISQVITDYSNTMIPGFPIVKAMGFLLSWSSAAILIGVFVSTTFNPAIVEGLRGCKRQMP
jgi:hypothetical protein